MAALRAPDWDWPFPVDGSLALKAPEPCATVPSMSPPAPKRRARRTRSRHLDRERRRRRLAVLIAVLLVAIVTLLLSAFGGSGSPAPAAAHRERRPSPAGGPAAPGGRRPPGRAPPPAAGQPVARDGDRIQGGSEGSLALSPVGTQANEGLLKRVLHSVVGGSSGRPRWYQLPGGLGPGSSSIDVGAPAGTDVYAPVDGTIVAIDDVVLNDRVYGSQIDIQPTGAPSLVVSVSHVRVDPSLVVGSSVTAAGSKLGSVVDFTPAEHQALAQYTNDSGNHVEIEVHPSATLSVG